MVTHKDFVILVLVVWAIHKRTNEIKDKTDLQEIEQRRLNEKLKIHEQLIDVKVEIKELQKKVFKK